MGLERGEIQAVTGAFSYTGSYIADRLRRRGVEVRALVRRTPSHTESGFDCRPLQFADSDRLAQDLEGAEVLYNTYWIRFERGGMTFADAVRNTGILARAAARAGVGRIVHLSVSNPSHTSPFAYFRGKAAAEDFVLDAAVPCSIIRPTLVFGNEDILINNMAWILRHLHAFILPGTGSYRVQPVFVGDVAHLALSQSEVSGNRVLDAAGPEILEFRQLLTQLRAATNTKAVIVPTPPPVALALGQFVSVVLRDTLITEEELRALMAETLVSSEPPTATTAFREWAGRNSGNLGRRYQSELRRHWASV